MSEQIPASAWRFSQPVRHWFQATFSNPTPPQARGWPAIQRGDHTLILAPTGLGKTLAAFLWGIDTLYQELSACGDESPPPGVRLVYISPLKALNNDVYRNLRQPLSGIRRIARQLDLPFPEIRTAVRSGDTPARDRQAMVRKPPHILITTPESLYLLLTSPRAREMFRLTRTVIVDEIHTLAGNKRGVHLTLSLERLAELVPHPIQRIGLSATIRPLDEVARFLGGNEPPVEQAGPPAEQAGPPAEQAGPPAEQAGPPAEQAGQLTPRPVTIVDASPTSGVAAAAKALDLQVVTPIDDFRNLPGDSIWPTLIPRLLALIRGHQTTLIFCNSRRLAERTASRLNEQLAAEAEGRLSGLIEDGYTPGLGFMAAGTGAAPVVIRAHHGSVSREARLEMERDLKAGKMRALVATSSLELGIDIGSVDLVIQLKAPKSVAQGLQRVGRSGHLVGETSKGRIFPVHREDVMEAAAVAGGMLRGQVEPTYTPRNPLDVLAQQIVAMVSVQNWGVETLYHLIRRTYAYQDLTRPVYHQVLEMLAGRYPSAAHRELRPRLVWDRVNNQLAALPASRLLALTNGGTIADRGAFAAYISGSRTKLGELDEEFIYETRTGDTFLLGSQVWRVTEITDDRIMVQPAAGATPRMPFWRGEYAWRAYELGQHIGRFRREVAARLQAIGGEWEFYRQVRDYREGRPVKELLAWLAEEYALDRNAAWQVLDYVAGQLDSSGAISSDRCVVVEIFEDDLGTPHMVVHSPFGGRVNGPWGLALAGMLREQTGVKVEVQSNDDGILLRFPETDTPFPLDLVSRLGPAEARERLLSELPDSALFGAQFRQNAARALLLPGNRPGKRTPFWLQRLRAKDLLQVVRRFPDFPILIETYRDCLEDVMDWPSLEQVLQGIQAGEITVQARRMSVPSPVAAGLLWQFSEIFMYEWDTPKAERQLQQLAVDRALLQDVLKDVSLGNLLKSEAIAVVTDQLQHIFPTAHARSAEELAVILEQLGDLSMAEVNERVADDPAPWLQRLSGQGRVQLLTIPSAHGPTERWVGTFLLSEYQAAFDPQSPDEAARRAILQRYLQNGGPLTVDAIRRRYDFPVDWLSVELARLVERGELAQGRFTPGDDGPTQYLDRHSLAQIHRRTLGMLRREVQPVSRADYAAFLARRQYCHPETHRQGSEGLLTVLRQLHALPVVGPVWERDLLPLRLPDFRPAELAGLCQRGELIWLVSGGSTPRLGRVRFLFRGEGRPYLGPIPEEPDFLSAAAQQVYELLNGEGALFESELQYGLDLAAAERQAALGELVMHGLVTNDNLAVLHRLWAEGLPATRERPHFSSSLEAQLAARRGEASLPGATTRRPGQAAYRAAKKRVRERLGQDALSLEPTPSEGRWSLVHRLGVLGKQLTLPEQVARQARQLLQRWGVVTRETLALEEGPWDWGLLYRHFTLLEMRGELRRGVFVSGLPGLQFALPDVVETLRTVRTTVEADATPLVLNACDPANLYGPSLEDSPQTTSGQPLTFARRPTTWLVLQRGRPLLVVEGRGSTVTTVRGVAEEDLRRAWSALLDHLTHFESRLTVETWDGQPILESDGRSLLESLGFRRDYPEMTWERSW